MDFPLLSETVEVRGRTFVVRELSMDQLLPLTGADMPDQERSQRILEAAVTLDGEPVRVGSLPASVFNDLARLVMRVNGLAQEAEENASGNP